MPKREDIRSILVIGSGPIVIGQACEFDYSGTQACKALKEEGYRVIVVNSNPATIMTDPTISDRVYIEPLELKTLESIIEREKPDALLPIMGGQTALNLALELHDAGVLAQYGVTLLGVTVDAIRKAEDRKAFDEVMHSVGLETPRSVILHSMQDVLEAADTVGFPAIVRPSFTLGGTGGGVAYNVEEFVAICKKGLELSPVSQVLVDESLLGWKEFEMEVMCDAEGNAIIVCSIENIEPMGVHTGDSITVAPALTLTDKEYQRMRDMAIQVLRAVGMRTGGSNVQFAVHPQTGRIVVIEMNPRVSRSSALASKATGFPIAKVAAKLAVGYLLHELRNEITGGVIPVSFEPTIDYIVVKMPRFAFEKFPGASPVLSTQMKAIGEVMAIGGTFQEALQKALVSMEIGVHGLDTQYFAKKEWASMDSAEKDNVTDSIYNSLSNATPERIFVIADAFRAKMSVEMVYERTSIDPWFLHQIEELVHFEEQICTLVALSSEASQTTTTALLEKVLDKEILSEAKRKGFSDDKIAQMCNVSGETVRALRKQWGIIPAFCRIDGCAGEFRATTAYMYSTYHVEQCYSENASDDQRKSVAIIGSGPNRIGQGIEFDYCCVHAAQAVKESGYKSVMINCNPETVSTDFDSSDALYFEPITLEHVLSILEQENLYGVILQMGGQTPLRLAKGLSQEGYTILGTSSESIWMAEERGCFSTMLTQLAILQPPHAMVRTLEEAYTAAEHIGFPVMLRPSFVLGGRAMQVVYTKEQLAEFVGEALQVSEKAEVLLDKFLEGAIEVDVDVIADGTRTVVGGILEHIEAVGVHSGDSMCVLPPHTLSPAIQEKMIAIALALSAKLEVKGLMNIQFAVWRDEVYVIEVNPRASRTVPFISKCIGTSLAKIATKAMLGISLQEQHFTEQPCPKHFAIKVPVFPFDKFSASQIMLGPEMRSTGELMGLGETVEEAMYKGFLGVYGALLNKAARDAKYVFFSIANKEESKRIIELATCFIAHGFSLLATRGTAALLEKENIPVTVVNKVSEGRPHVVDFMKNNSVFLVINSVGYGKTTATNDAMIIRRNALQARIPCLLTLEAAFAFARAWEYRNTLRVRHLAELA